MKEGYGNDLAALAALPHAKPHLTDGVLRNQNRGPMEKNRIEGRHGASRGHTPLRLKPHVTEKSMETLKNEPVKCEVKALAQ